MISVKKNYLIKWVAGILVRLKIKLAICEVKW